MNVLTPIPTTTVHYPESDGKPMAETDVHRKQLLDLDFALRTYFHNNPGVYVAGNLLIYYVEGDPRECVAPDIFVVKGVPNHDRRVFKVWEEGKAPDVVVELTSDSTRHEDMGHKRSVYAQLGVREYFVFDPLGQYLKPPLRGYRLVDDEYVLMDEGQLMSRELGLELRVEDGRLRLYEPRARRYLLSPEETQAEAEREKAEGEREKLRADRAEAENARLRAELERLRGSAD